MMIDTPPVSSFHAVDRLKGPVGIVTVTYNSGAVIDRFMQSLLSQTYTDFHAYVVDNASTDSTLSQLQNYNDSRMMTIPNSQNVGVAEGNNQGIKLCLDANCAYVLLLNNDTEFPPDLLEKMLVAFSKRATDMLVPKILFYEPNTTIWCAGGYFKRWVGCATGHHGEGQPDDGSFDQSKQVFYAPTCCMLIDSNVFKTLGMMDPRYFVYYDDTDFCWRAMKMGLQLWYDPDPVLYHKVSSLTGGSASDFTVRYSTRNKIYFTLKNRSFLMIIYCLVVYQLIFVIKLLIRRDSLRIYVLKLTAFTDGVRLFLSAMGSK